jgi:hypothetical protein
MRPIDAPYRPFSLHSFPWLIADQQKCRLWSSKTPPLPQERSLRRRFEALFFGDLLLKSAHFSGEFSRGAQIITTMHQPW